MKSKVLSNNFTKISLKGKLPSAVNVICSEVNRIPKSNGSTATKGVAGSVSVSLSKAIRASSSGKSIQSITFQTSW